MFPSQIMQGGHLPYLTAQTIAGTGNAAVAAAGNSQGTATALAIDINYVTTVAASSGVILFGAEAGAEVFVANAQGINALLVYPPTGGAINGLATNAGYTVAVNKGAVFKCVDGSKWIAVGG